MFLRGWRRGSALLWFATFENGDAAYVAFGRNRAGLPVYRQDRTRCALVPMCLSYPDCFAIMPTALMTSRLIRRRLSSILGEYGTIIEDSQPASVGKGLVSRT